MTESKNYALIGYACDQAGARPGAKDGPRVLRLRKLVETLQELNIDLADLGDCSDNLFQSDMPKLSKSEKSMQNAAAVYRACKHLYQKTSEALSSKRLPLIVGGDHSGAIGSFAAVSDFYQLQGKKVGLIYFDAHPDCHDWQSSTSKRIYGATIGVLSGQADGALKTLQKKQSPSLDLTSLAYIGLRDVDPAERKFISNHKICAKSMKEIDRFGMARCIEEAIEVAGKGTAGFFVSFDIDACDPQIVPGTQLPIRGGISFRESHLALEMIYDSGKLLGFELSEFNPGLDIDHSTSDFCISLLESVCGKSIL